MTEHPKTTGDTPPALTTPYPTALPVSEAMDVVNYVRGSVTDKARVTHSAWVVAGYGLSQWQPAPMTSSPAPGDHGVVTSAALERNQAADALEQAVVRHRAGSPEAGVIPWAILLPVLIQIITAWFNRPKTGGDEPADPWGRPPGEK